MAGSLAAYNKADRGSKPEKADISVLGMGAVFMWRFFTIGARVTALALFASHFEHWVLVVMGAHW